MAVVNLRLYLTLLVSSVLFFPAANGQHYANPPLVIGPGDRIPEPLVVNKDSLVAFFVNEETDQVKVIFSADQGHTWSAPPALPFRAARPLRDRSGAIHLFYFKNREDRPWTTWYRKSFDQGKTWTSSTEILSQRGGAVMPPIELGSGRILFPTHFRIRSRSHPKGACQTITMYSEDQGENWITSTTPIETPCYPEFNGNNFGAVEPSILAVGNDSVWLLVRSQTDYLYQSYSGDGGATWSVATPSPFYSSTSPPALLRLPDGRILLVWNNCDNSSKYKGQRIYGGRDVIHAAISEDNGKSWIGFREVYRDPHRIGHQPSTGDRGTAYPNVVSLSDTSVILITGQGNRRGIVRFDPNWLYDAKQTETFQEGLVNWCVFKPFGSVHGVIRDRKQGAQLRAHPNLADSYVLHLRHENQEETADGASWNFPMSRRGRLKLRIQLQPDCKDISISLGDRFFDPTEDTGEELAIFRLQVNELGLIAEGTQLEKGKWHELMMEWDLDIGKCQVFLDGLPSVDLQERRVPTFGVTRLNELKSQIGLPVPSLKPETIGISYLRLRASIEQVDRFGFLVESVEADKSH